MEYLVGTAWHDRPFRNKKIYVQTKINPPVYSSITSKLFWSLFYCLESNYCCMLLQMGPFHALKGKVEHNDEKTDVAKAHWDEKISKGEILCLILLGVPKYFGLVQIFCARSKIDFHIVLIPNSWCQTKSW